MQRFEAAAQLHELVDDGQGGPGPSTAQAQVRLADEGGGGGDRGARHAARGALPQGSFNVPEYGTVADKAQFTALHAYSPYHHVTAKAPYPATLFMTGETDGRVAPWHSRKMVAAMQAARAGNAPILLRTSSTSGHGQGTASSEQIEQLSDVIAFVHWQLR